MAAATRGLHAHIEGLLWQAMLNHEYEGNLYWSSLGVLLLLCSMYSFWLARQKRTSGSTREAENFTWGGVFVLLFVLIALYQVLTH